MTIAIVILGVLVAVLLLFVVALLRSHAEILRRLAGIEASLDGGDFSLTRADPLARPAGISLRRGQRAADIAGQSLNGDGVALSLAPGAPPTLLAFMSSTCNVCAGLWDGLHAGPVPTPAGSRLVVVTKGPERERLARLLELAPDDAEVVMSSQAWEDFIIPSTPHFVLVRDGQIAGRGAASSWEQITGFLSDAADDDALHRARSLNTNQRAARAEQALAEAGIGPGHPSLYPSQISPAGETDDDMRGREDD